MSGENCYAKQDRGLRQIKDYAKVSLGTLNKEKIRSFFHYFFLFPSMYILLLAYVMTEYFE